MTTQHDQATRFHALHQPGHPLVLFNIWDPGSAKAVAAAGAAAVATGSWSVAAANGFDDGERMPLELALANLRRIVAATTLPVTIDLESGYGETPEHVATTVLAALDAGAVGCNIEDSFPESGALRDAAISRSASPRRARPPIRPASRCSSTRAAMCSSRSPAKRTTRGWSTQPSTVRAPMPPRARVGCSCPACPMKS